LTDLLLARSEQTAQRFYSMSAKIRTERDEYYRFLEATQKGDLDATPWMEWFLNCLGKAFAGAESDLAFVLFKAQFWDSYRALALNERQRMMVNTLLEHFEGKLTTSKWAKLTKSSQDTALRDIDGLIEHGILQKDRAGGRSTSYSLVAKK
jgi:Fic family protein